MNEITLERTLPHSLESERAVLGAILLEPKAVFAASACLSPEDFYLEAHRLIFQRCMDLAVESCPVEAITLIEELRRHGELERAGGAAYIASLTDGMPRGSNVAHYARTVREKATARQMIRLAHETMVRCYEGAEVVQAVIEGHEAEVFRIAAREIRGGLERTSSLVGTAYKQIEETSNRKSAVRGLETGFAEFDRITGGLMPQELIIVAARPGLGKTSLCLNVAAHVAIRKHQHVAVFSLEMSKGALVRRLLCAEAEVDAHKVRTGFLNRDDWMKLGRAAASLDAAPISLDDSANQTVLSIHAKAQRCKLERGLDLVIVDYLQLLRGTGKRYENRTQEVTEISRGLKMLAKELDLPVIAVSQLNREIEKRGGNRRLQLSDLRESGAIEQDADLVLFISREEIMHLTEENAGMAEITIAKHRDGSNGDFKLAFMQRFTKFANLWQEGEFSY